MQHLVIQKQIQEQINALKAATDKAVQSKESAIQYLIDSGITKKEEEQNAYNLIKKKK